MMKTLAITGGIGSGKSYVAKMLQTHFSIPVYNCDAEAKRLNVESPAIRQRLTQLVGTEVYAPDGSLQKQVLAQYLFSSPDNAQRVNAITHPVVAHDFEQWVIRQAAEGHKLVAMECAILFESGFDRLADVIINVSAPHELCLQRAMDRDKANAEAISRRMALQLSDEERTRRSHFTILNDGRDIISQIELIISKNKN